MSRGLLNYFSIWIQNISCKSSICSRKFIPSRSLKENKGQSKHIVQDFLCCLHIFVHLFHSIFFSSMSAMGFNPVEFSASKKRPCSLRLVSKNICSLISLERQIFMAPNP